MLSKSSWSFTDRGALGSIFQWPTSSGGRMEGTLLGVHKTRMDVLTDPCLPPLLDNPNCWAMQQLVRMPNLKVTWKIWGFEIWGFEALAMHTSSRRLFHLSCSHWRQTLTTKVVKLTRKWIPDIGRCASSLSAMNGRARQDGSTLHLGLSENFGHWYKVPRRRKKINFFVDLVVREGG